MNRIIRFAAVCALLSGLRATDLRSEIDHIAETVGGPIGVSAVLVETGEHIAFHGDRPFFMASTVKFPVALQVLHLVDQGKLRLDQKVPVVGSVRSPGVMTLGGMFKPGAKFTIRELLSSMILNSDNTACDVLMRISGGPQAILARVQALGIRGIRISRTEKQLAAAYRRSRSRFLNDTRDTSTPEAMAALLAKISAGRDLRAGKYGSIKKTDGRDYDVSESPEWDASSRHDHGAQDGDMARGSHQ